MMYVCFYLVCVLFVDGFLINQNATTSGLTESNFISVMKLVLEEKQQRLQLENFITRLQREVEAINKTAVAGRSVAENLERLAVTRKDEIISLHNQSAYFKQEGINVLIFFQMT